MNCKPILFNTDMVRAILAGQKTQTRRLMKPQPTKPRWNNIGWLGWDDGHGRRMKSPCETGDVLWVRETWNGDWADHYIYKADGGSAVAAGYEREPIWHPSIHMPKEAARIFLRVKRVEVERLQDITAEDCIREGVEEAVLSVVGEEFTKGIFSAIWDSTIKKADLPYYGWDANPWVWAIEFERCEKPEGWN